MKSLVIGAGEVGTSLKKVLSPYHETFIKDKEPLDCPHVEVLHICYPDHADFVKTTKDYIRQYRPNLAIIHSSIKVGTTRACGDDVVYSPMRGRHPDNGLENEMKWFIKYVAAVDSYYANEAQRYFNERSQWPSKVAETPESLEYLKLISNVHMGLEIAWRQEVKRMEDYFKLEPGLYEEWEKTYRNGYLALGQKDIIRPIMRPDPIGGHCIIPCTEILDSQFPSEFMRLILESNEQAKREQNGECGKIGTDSQIGGGVIASGGSGQLAKRECSV